MATPNNLAENVATTLRNRSKKLADAVSNNNALLYRLKEKGNSRTFGGGRTIVDEIEYAENSTFQWFAGYEQLNISPSDVITFAEYEIKQASVAISMSGLERLQNSGKEQVIDLLEARIKNAERTMLNNISTGVYSDGTGSGGKQIGGLQLLVADTGLSTAGGISSTTWAFWRNQVYDFSSNSVTPGAATIQSAMNTLYLNCSRGANRPDLIVADNTYFRYYWESLQAHQRITNDKMAAAGFDNLKFMGADVVFDGGQDGAAPSNHMYFLNTEFLKYRPHKDCNMTPSADRFATNQDAMVQLLLWAGNLTCSQRALQGVIVA